MHKPSFVRSVSFAFATVAISIFVTPSQAQDFRVATPPINLSNAQPVFAQHGMVVAQEKIAAEIGADILKRGGNAVDAAVATGFAMAVTYPRAGNLGGGGFMVIHLAKDNKDITLDYRETAPAAATPTMFLDASGKPDPNKSRNSALGIGVPGTVAGLSLALKTYGSGRFSLHDLVEPAIKLARDGFVLADDLADTLDDGQKQSSRWPAGTQIFSRADGMPLHEGDMLVQGDLADTLQAIADQGPSGFYDGAVADKLVDGIHSAGGIITRNDLKSYRAQWRDPVRGTYRGYDIVSMPLPSSGGTVLIETLNILEGFDLSHMGAQTPASLHVLIEAMKRAYADRARYLGDPAFSEAPLKQLLSKDYAAKQRGSIELAKATPAAAIFTPAAMAHEGTNTTHFSVVDADGNAVSNTYTLNFSYGVGLVPPGTGVLLNNELDDFTAAPGASNAYGLVGYEANLPGPGKRPLSSMTPTIILKDGKPVLVTGTPGGSRIISATLQVVVNVLDFHMNAAQAVDVPRVHDQWLPDEVRVEHGFPQSTLDALAAMGHKIVIPLGQTSANSIAVTENGKFGAPDPRTRGATAAGY